MKLQRIPFSKEEIAKMAWNAAHDKRNSPELPKNMSIDCTPENTQIWERNYTLYQLESEKQKGGPE